MRPIDAAPVSVNQMLPSGPTLMSLILDAKLGEYSVKVPFGVILPMIVPEQYQTFPSLPLISLAVVTPEGVAKDVLTPVVEMREMVLLKIFDVQ